MSREETSTTCAVKMLFIQFLQTFHGAVFTLRRSFTEDTFGQS